MPFYELGRENGGSFDLGIEQIVMGVLASPEFLYRSIRGIEARRNASADTEVPLTDLELASRLSFFLWNSGPDDSLLALAAAGGLSKPGALDKEVTRMMADPKASSLVASFAMKWLNIADLDAVKPDPMIFPDFTEECSARRSQRCGSAYGGLHVPERTAGPPLWHFESFWTSIPPGHADRKRALGFTGQGRGAAADFLRRPHIPGSAWRVGDG
jgi:hypothetical protein